MGKVCSRDRGSMNPKQKRRLRSSSSRYLRPGALSKLKYNKVSEAKPCTDLGRKRVAVLDAEELDSDAVKETKDNAETPTPLLSLDVCKENHLLRTPKAPRVEVCENQLGCESLPMLSPVDLWKQNNLLRTPKTPVAEGCDTESRLESLPMDLLVKLMCHLHHDQLRAVFHVSTRVRKAVIQARLYYFNYTTPDRSRQEMLRTMTPRPTEHWPFIGKRDGKGILIPTPHTPKAPRHGPRPPRIKFTEMRQIAAVLFQESAFSQRCMVPSVLSKRLCNSVASNRALFYEDDLCQAVAQNKLR